MDRRERFSNQEEVLRSLIDETLAMTWTSIPGIVQSFDNAAMTCTVQPAIMVKVFNPTLQTWVDTKLPLLLDVPVIFPSGGGFTLTFPLKPGDEGLVSFSSRCIDSWWQSGGVQPQTELRFQDLSDGFIQVGIRSQPRVLPLVNTEFAELRSDDDQTYVQIQPTRVNIVAPEEIVATAPLVTANTTNAVLNASEKITLNTPIVEISGTLHVLNSEGAPAPCQVSGDITTNGDVIASGVSLVHHVHDGVTTGSGNTGEPV